MHGAAGVRKDENFTGHIRDDDIGLIYMQARYYDYGVGRFYSTDPIGYQDQLNLYAYVHNDPVNGFDPNGREACHPQFGCSGNRALSNQGPFSRGLLSVPEAYANFAAQQANLKSSNPAIRARAIAVDNAAGIAANFFLNNPVESLELVAKGISENKAFAAGRTVASVAVGVGVTKGIGAAGGAAAAIAVGNFSITQVGSAIGAIDGLFRKIEGAGFDPSLLSNDAVANAFYAGASGVNLNFDQKSGTVSASVTTGRAGSRIKTTTTVDICTFNEDGQCQ